LKLRINVLPEPEIEVGHGLRGTEPKLILPEGGPFGSIYTIDNKNNHRIGVSAREQGAIRFWIDSMNGPLLDDETNIKRFREYPGAEKAFRARFDLQIVRELDDEKFRACLERFSTRAIQRPAGNCTPMQSNPYS